MNEIKIIKFLLEWILNNIFLFTLENLNFIILIGLMISIFESTNSLEN